MMYNLLLYDRLTIDSAASSFRRNITQVAQDWHRTTRARGGYFAGDFTITRDDMTQGEMVDLYNAAIGWRVVEKSYGITTWEGEIMQMRLTLDGLTWLRSMDTARWHNRVKILWGGGETAWGEDTDSTGLYGDSEYIEQAPSMYNQTAAEARRDRLLAQDAYPRSRAQGGLVIDPAREGEADGLTVTCAGHVFSMNRRHRETDTAPANASAQVSTLVGESEFVTAGNIDTNTLQVPISTGGTPTPLWDLIEEIIVMGDASGNEWAGGVYADREFDLVAAETDVTHYWRNGQLYDEAGSSVLATHVKPDILVEIVGAPRGRILSGASTWDQPNRAYIEEVEFQAPDKLRLIPRLPRTVI
jgi:hypothetical protein